MKNHTKKRVFIAIILLVLLISILSAWKLFSFDRRVARMCKNKDSIIAHELVGFEWDIAYIGGEGIKERFHLEGNFRDVPSEYHVIAFVKDGQLVKDYLCHISVLCFANGKNDEEDEVIILPETRLYIWRAKNLTVLRLNE